MATIPPFTAGLIARYANRLWKIPYLLDFRDAWTHNPYLPAVSSLHQAIQENLECRTTKGAAGVVFVNPALHDHYRKKYQLLNDENSRVIRNGYDVDDFNLNDIKEVDKSPKTFRIGIMGTIYSQGNAPLTLLEAFSRLMGKKSVLAQNLRLIFVGKWTREFYSRVSALSISSQVEFISYRPHKEALALAREWDALTLAIQGGIDGSEMVTPGRIYEYLYLKKPIITLAEYKKGMKYSSLSVNVRFIIIKLQH